MDTSFSPRSLAYWIIAAGVLLSFVSAVVPFYHAGHILLYEVMLAGMLPYLVYGIAVPLLRTGPILVVGFLLLGAHTWLVVSERFVGGAHYSAGMIYYVPLLLSVALLPLPIMVLRKPY